MHSLLGTGFILAVFLSAWKLKKTLLALREDETDHNIKSEKMSSSEHGMELFARLDSITIKKEVISVIVHISPLKSDEQ